MNIYWILLWEKPKDSWFWNRHSRITSTHSLGFQNKALLGGSRASSGVLVWRAPVRHGLRIFPDKDNLNLVSLWQITTNGRGSFRPASFPLLPTRTELQLVPNHPKPPRSSYQPWPFKSNILPDSRVALTLGYWVWDCQRLIPSVW